MRSPSVAALLLTLAACGGSERLAYTCPVDLGPGFVGADQELPCAQVARNVAIARGIMSEASSDFGESLIQSIVIRDVESWTVDRSRCWGLTTFNGSQARLSLGHSMWSLSHELGHVFLKYRTGDSDHLHARWASSGQQDRDARYQRTFEPLAPLARSIVNARGESATSGAATPSEPSQSVAE